MKNLIKQNLDGKRILVLFILTSLIYTIMLTITIPRVMEFAGGKKLLDMIPSGYTHEYVDSLLTSLGESGRDAYLFNQIPLDMLYPLLFGVTYCLIFAYFLNKMKRLDGSLYYICLLPLLAGLFDYFENFGIINMLTSYPDNTVLMAQLTSAFSILKSFLTTIYFVALVLILGVMLVKKMSFKRKLKGI